MTTVTDNSVEQINAALLNLKRDIANGSLTETKIKEIAINTSKDSSSGIDLSGYASKAYLEQYIDQIIASLPNYATKEYVDRGDAALKSRIDNLSYPLIKVYRSTASPEVMPEVTSVTAYRHNISYTITYLSGIYKWFNSFMSNCQRVTLTNGTSTTIQAIITNERGAAEELVLNSGTSRTTGNLTAVWPNSPINVAPSCVTITWSPYTG